MHRGASGRGDDAPTEPNKAAVCQFFFFVDNTPRPSDEQPTPSRAIRTADVGLGFVRKIVLEYSVAEIFE